MSVECSTNLEDQKTNAVISSSQLKEAELLLLYKQAFKDAKLFEQDKLETYDIADLLNEL